ncbi:matrix-remodeling-associated protein 7 isoform 2-T2 [Discoglossus pictus]
MELDEDYSVTVPLIFTVLAVLLATLIIKLRKVPSQEAQEEEKEIVEELREETEKKEEELDREKTEAGVPVEEVGTVDDLPQEEVKEEEQEIVTEQSAPQERRGSSHSSQEEDSKEEDFDAESDKVLKISEADDADDESLPFQYLPGKLRGSEFEKMLTKEELEEEQRTEDVMKLHLTSS